MANTNSEGPAKQALAIGMTTLQRGVEKIYANGDFCDAVIACQGHEWKVHKMMLASRSDSFRKMLLSACKEGIYLKIDMSNGHPRTVDAIIAYLYSGDYADDGTDNSRPESLGAVDALVLNVRAFVLADEHFILGLKELAAQKYQARAKTEWHTPAFLGSVKETYEAGSLRDRTLHDIFLGIIKQHIGAAFLEPSKNEQLRAVMDTTHEFATDLAMKLVVSDFVKEKMKDVPTYRCSVCHGVFALVLKTGTGSPWANVFCPANCKHHSATQRTALVPINEKVFD